MPRAGTATDQRRLHGWLAEKMMDSLLCLFLFLFLFFFPSGVRVLGLHQDFHGNSSAAADNNASTFSFSLPFCHSYHSILHHLGLKAVPWVHPCLIPCSCCYIPL